MSGAHSQRIPGPLRLGLSEAARSLRDRNPWLWMQEGDFFGLVDPVSRQLCVGSFLPGENPHPGFVLYRGSAGIRFLFRAEDDPGNPLDREIPMFEDSLLVEFVPLGELASEDLDCLALDSLAPQKKRRPKVAGYPRFRSQLPFHPPERITPAEAELLRTALILADGFAGVVEETADFYGERPEHEVPVYSRVGDQADSPWRMDWIELDLSPPPLPAAFLVPPERLVSVLALPVEPAAAWEVDYFFPPTVIQGPGRPYFPRTVMIADVETGRFLDADLAHPDVPLPDQVGAALIETMHQHSLRPAALYIADTVIAETLWPLAEQLGVRLRFRSQLRQIPTISEFLAKKFATQGPGDLAPPTQ